MDANAAFQHVQDFLYGPANDHEFAADHAASLVTFVIHGGFTPGAIDAPTRPERVRLTLAECAKVLAYAWDRRDVVTTYATSLPSEPGFVM